MKLSSTIQSCLVVLLATTSASAFVSQGQQQHLGPTTVSMVAEKAPGDISYGEESRKYRRTIFTHDDWVKYRSPDRFWRNLGAINNSGIYKNVFKEISATTGVATFVVLYNCLVGGYTDFGGTQMQGLLSESLPVLGLPLVPFTLASPSLGLLLAFRANTSYKRWDEARKNWGMNINHSRDLVRMASAYYDDTAVEDDERRKQDLQTVALATWAFVRSMKRHLSPETEDEEDFRQELLDKLPVGQAQTIIGAAHRPNRALFDLSVAIENLPMHFLRKNQIHAAVTIFEDNLGSSERLLTSPVPLFYSRHTARFLSVWLLLLPFALWQPLGGTWNHLGVIPVTFFVSLFLFGIEELATQLEEPFTILPMQAYTERIGMWCNEIVSFEPATAATGDNDVDQEMVSSETDTTYVTMATTNGEDTVNDDDKEPIVEMSNGAAAPGEGRLEKLRSLVAVDHEHSI